MAKPIKIRVGRWQIEYTPGGQYADIGHIEEGYAPCDCINYRWDGETHEPTKAGLRLDLMDWIDDHGATYEQAIFVA
jgi:hypothetical protein